MATTSTLLRPGDVLGGFCVEDVIGVGGMAIVYRAEQVSLGRPVALKVLSSRLTSDPSFRERFRREGTHAAALEHPNIVPVYDSGEEDGLLYLAMRLVEGTNLAELVQTRGVTADQTIELLRPIASALDTAHAGGLIHRDVKPQNILITAQNHPYLADFGVSKGSNTYGLTATGGFVGSVNYAAPEQINGLTLTPASDVYALTAVLYQCLTGRVPYERETDAGIMQAHLTAPPPTLPSTGGADTDFHSVLARGMAKDPGARYGHAGDLITAAALSVARLPSHMRTSVPAFPLPAAEPAEAAAPPRPAASAPRANHTEIIAAEERLARATAPPSMTAVDIRREPAPSPDAVTATGRRRRPPNLVLAVAAAGLLVAVLLVSAVSGGSGSARSRTYTSGILTLAADSSWKPEPASRAPLAGAQIAVLGRGSTVAVLGSVAQQPVAASPPPQLRTYGAPDTRATVSLPLGPARLYAWHGAGSHAPLLLYVIATSAGEALLGCNAPSASLAASSCASLAGRARLVGAKVEYPGPDAALGGVLAQALTSRQAAVSRVVTLPVNTGLPARATALRALTSADSAAAAALAGAVARPRYAADTEHLRQSLSQESADVAQLAGAARANDRSRYASLRSGLVGTAEPLRRVAAALQARGFRLPAITAVSAPGLPALPRRSPQPAAKTPAVSTPVATPAPASPPAEPVAPPSEVAKPQPRSSGGNSSGGGGGGGQIIITEPK